MKDFLKKVLGKDEKFYELLEASADEAQKSAKSLSKLYAQVGKPDFEQCFTELVVARRVDKRIGLSITQELCKTFVTPLEREDIEALANALYKIPKTCEKIGERLAICPSQFSIDIVDKQVRMLEQATEVTARLVRKLRKLSNVEEIQDEYETLQTIEGDADRLMVGLLRDLYQGNVDAKEVVILKDIYELLERAIDHCRDAGKVVFQIALKYA
ncbi:MAG: phosphate transport regulator [Opitutia bacterium]|nr:MAG: phosphate transport regulator [Opitutae bacterium]